jgi:asparagine synthetase B (glutamine-hydrolysing)
VSHGWLLRCDPAEGRCEVRLGRGGSMHEDGGVTVVCAGAADPVEALAAYRRRGPTSPAAACATAVWDGPRRTLHLLRDHTGVYPLFHARGARGTLLAGPDAEALLAEPGVDLRLSAVAVAEWLLERLSPPEETLIEALRRVPAGHVLTEHAGGRTLRRDWEPPPRGSLPAAEAGRFGEALEAAVARVVDRPAAVFLSGGIDSASVATAARAVSERGGLPAPLALCADLEGSSELETQRRVAEGLGLPLLLEPFRPSAEELVRSLELTAAMLWPAASAWFSVWGTLRQAALGRGAVVLLDGGGGDELLDPGLDPARGFLRRARLGALFDLARAEHAYTGAHAHTVLRAAVGRGRPAPREPLPDWIRDPALRAALEERAASAPSDDLLDGFGAAAREASFAAAQEGGYVHAHPFYDHEVVALGRGLPEEALVRGGDPKSPARAYVRSALPQIAGRWPRPAVVGSMQDDLLARVRESPPAAGVLAGLGLDHSNGRWESGLAWARMSLAAWFDNLEHRMRPEEGQ